MYRNYKPADVYYYSLEEEEGGSLSIRGGDDNFLFRNLDIHAMTSSSRRSTYNLSAFIKTKKAFNSRCIYYERGVRADSIDDALFIAKNNVIRLFLDSIGCLELTTKDYINDQVERLREERRIS